MKIECMGKANLKWEIDNRIKALKEDSTLKIEITPCDILKGTYDLNITEEKKWKLIKKGILALKKSS